MNTYQRNFQTSTSDHLFLYLIISVTGAAVMMIDLMGTRIIEPFYGASLFVWSSLKEISIETKNAFVVTDDYNPLESLQVAKAEHYRELLMKRLGKEILLR